MAEAYWTYCFVCSEMICGVEILDDYPDVVVLYAHRDCYESYKDGRPIAAPEKFESKRFCSDKGTIRYVLE
jgi:hypothetical protein